VDPVVVEGLVRARLARPRSSLAALTPREREVLSQMAQGHSNDGIARALHITGKVVEKHINALFAKLGLADEPDTNRRVKAVLIHLAHDEAHRAAR
jgi:DNA-binding NarL/FixJ family response regulator